jgi:hypothetical protein
MDVLVAYREVGSYRGAAEICGTTHKTAGQDGEADAVDGGLRAVRLGEVLSGDHDDS